MDLSIPKAQEEDLEVHKEQLVGLSEDNSGADCGRSGRVVSNVWVGAPLTCHYDLASTTHPRPPGERSRLSTVFSSLP